MSQQGGQGGAVESALDTPNKELIDWIEERLLGIYEYERLKDCDIDYLYNREFGIEARMKIFEVMFPGDNTALSGLERQWAGMDRDKKPLTDVEVMRLELMKMEAEMEIHRAFGHRLQLKREHRGKLANSFADMVGRMFSIFS